MAQSFNPVLDSPIPSRLRRMFELIYTSKIKRFLKNTSTEEEDVMDYMEAKFQRDFRRGWKRRYVISTIAKINMTIAREDTTSSDDGCTSPPTSPSAWGSSSGEETYDERRINKSNIGKKYFRPQHDQTESYYEKKLRIKKFPLIEEEPADLESERTMKNFPAEETSYDRERKLCDEMARQRRRLAREG